MRILLTGATGFLGGRLAHRLLADGHELRATRRPSSQVGVLGPLAKAMAWFLDDDAGIAAAVEGCDAVIHAACSYGRSGESAAVVAASNLLFPLRVLDSARAAAVPAFFDIGTALPRALSSYTLAKHQFAEWGRSSASVPAFVHLRLQHFYGPGQSPQTFLAWLVSRCLQGGDVPLTLGEQKRDFVHVDDVVAAIVLLLLQPYPANTEYQIGSGRAMRLREVVETVSALAAGPVRLHFGAIPYRDGEPMRCVADIDGLSSLGWKPTVRFEDGVADMIDYARASERRG